MKNIFAIFLIACPLLAIAQTGTVKLLDANGIELSNYNSITLAYAAIPQPLTQAYTIELQNGFWGSNESIPITFGAKTGASPSNTITIRPALGASGISLAYYVANNSLILFDEADYVILDGRPGGVGTSSAFTVNNTALIGTANTIGLINGATNNIIRYMTLQNNSTGGSSRTVGLLGSTDPAGNSNNRIEYNSHQGSYLGINSIGTIANPNRHNIIRGNVFTGVLFTAIWIQGGTAGILIDSNIISSTSYMSNSIPFGILFDNQTDTAIIRNNRIFDLNSSANSSIVGICIRSTLSTGTTNYSEVYNNFISLGFNYAGTNVVGIEYSGTNHTIARVWNNSIYLGGTQTINTNLTIFSAAIMESLHDNGASSYEFRNNLLVNHRTGGNESGRHLGLATSSMNANFVGDYNTYNTPDGLARLRATLYCSTLSELRSNWGAPNEINADTTTIQFVSTTDLHLRGTSIGNLALIGAPIQQIIKDIDGDIRTTAPYRGADEALPSLGGINACSGTPTAGSINASNTHYCNGNPPVLLNLTGHTSGSTLYVLWKVSTDSVNFIDVPDVYSASLLVTPNQKSWYKAVVRCVPSGLLDSTQVIAVDIGQRATAGPLTFDRYELDYHFNLTNSVGVDSFRWNFGDGSPEVTTLTPTISHTYASYGAYTLLVQAINNCGADSIRLNLNITVSVANNTLSELKLYPNPFEDQLNISIENVLKSIRLTDMQGREIHSVYPMVSAYSWSLAHLPQGQYLLEIIDVNGRRSVKPLIKSAH